MLSARDLRRDLTTGRTTTTVLHGCDLELQGGGLTAVVGHSGSGKTSLLMCLSGLDQPTSGIVMINGRDVYRQSAGRRASMLRSEIGFVFQQYNLVPFIVAARRPVRSPAASSSGLRSAERSPAARASSSRTSRPERWTRKAPRSSWEHFGAWQTRDR